MRWCLLKSEVEKFKKALKDREITPEILQGFNKSSERRAFLAKYVGEENAKEVNALFESKLLLPHVERGVISASKKIISSQPVVRRDFENTVKNIEKLFDPENPDKFYEDLASTKLHMDMTQEEGATIDEFSKQVQELEKKYNPKTMKWESQKDADLYGATKRSLENYLNEVKYGKVTIKTALFNRGQQFKSEFANNPARAIGSLIVDTAKTIANTSTSTVATLDDSFFGRQGIMTLLTGHPKMWGKSFVKSFSDIGKTLSGKDVEDAVYTKLYSDPLYMNGEYLKAKIVDINEEQYPLSLESVPVIGRGAKAAEVAFKMGGLRTRTELYKTLRDTLTSSGVEMSKDQISGLGKVVNSTSARGYLGKYGDNPIARILMWAPKMLKADLDILTAHSFDNIPKEARVIARWNLIKIIFATALVTGTEKLLHKTDKNKFKDVELDPRSSDFLKIGGVGYLRNLPAIITLFSRLITDEYKDASGNIVKYEPGIGKRSRLSAVASFFRYKAPPATSAIYDILAEQDFQGNVPTFSSLLLQKAVPISLQNLIKLSSDPTIDKTFGVIGDFFGLNTNLTPEPNIKSNIVPSDVVINKGDLFSFIHTYARAIETDSETAFTKAFTGQKILQVGNGIVVVNKQDISDSEAFKKKWVKEHGGKTSDIKEVRLDHIVPNKLSGDEKEENWAVVPTSMWSSNTKVETTLIRAVKNKKLPLKEAQNLIRQYKRPKKDSQGYMTEDPDKEFGQQLINKYR